MENVSYAKRKIDAKIKLILEESQKLNQYTYIRIYDANLIQRTEKQIKELELLNLTFEYVHFNLILEKLCMLKIKLEENIFEEQQDAIINPKEEILQSKLFNHLNVIEKNINDINLLIKEKKISFWRESDVITIFIVIVMFLVVVLYSHTRNITGEISLTYQLLFTITLLIYGEMKLLIKEGRDKYFKYLDFKYLEIIYGILNFVLLMWFIYFLNAFLKI